MKEVLRGIKYALVVNVLIILVPIVMGVVDIYQSSQPEELKRFTRDLICYSTLGCHKTLSYIIFGIELIVSGSIFYFILRSRSYNLAEKRKSLVWFIISFPFAHYLMDHYVMGIIFLITTILKFGLVSIANY